MSRQLPQRVEAYIRRQLGIPPRLVHVPLLGHNFILREGTIRARADYDDAWFLACALHANTVFDVGAHTGDSTLMALLSPTVEKVVLVEANAKALSVAADNLILNQLSAKAHFVPAFAGEVDNTTVRFWTVGTGAAGSMYKSHAVSASKSNSYIEVSTVTLDSLCDRYGVTPDLVKIDVEGAEHKVLVGSRRCALKGTTRFLVEMHSNPDMPMEQNATLVLKWCRSVNYAAWYLKEGSACTHPAQIKHRGRCHLLLQPAQWPYPDWLKGLEQSAELTAVVPDRNRDE